MDSFAPWKKRAERFFVEYSAMFGGLLEDTRMSLVGNPSLTEMRHASRVVVTDIPRLLERR